MTGTTTLNKRISTLLWTGLALLGLACAASLWDRAFSSAAIDFKFSRQEIEHRMEDWLKDQNCPIDGLYHSVLFDESEDHKNYIELELGITHLSVLTQKGIHVWYWFGRWFRPEKKEEFQISLDPQGRLVMFNHEVEEAWAAPKISKKQARALAEEFLKKNATQHPLTRLRFIEDSTEQKPKRTDYSFTWERTDLRAKDAPYRVLVGVTGNRVGSYAEYLKIPEAWTRNFEKKQSLNELCQNIAEYGRITLYVGMVIFFILYAYQKKIDWRRAMPWQWLALFALVTVAADVNQLPSVIVHYDTKDNWFAYLLEQMSSSLRGALVAVLTLWVTARVIDPLYREKLGNKLPLRDALGFGSLQYRETARSLGLGVVFACVSMGYVCAFYVIGKKFGVWSPVEIDYSQTLSGWFPWIDGMETGLSATFNEEFIFRAFAILFYWKIFRVRWLAVVLSAATWGFLHSNYPQMPGYTRGIELTIEGTLWGVLMMRYGILTTLTAHYLYDCWLDSMIVWQSPSITDRIGALAVSLWPVALGLWSWLKYGRKGLLREYVPQEIIASAPRRGPAWWEKPASPWVFSYLRLGPMARCVLFLSCIGAILLSRQPSLPQDVFNDFGYLFTPRHAIAAKTNDLLTKHGQKPADYHKIVTLTSGYIPNSGLAVRYLLEHGPLEDLAQLAADEWPADLQWNVRCFRFGEKEEFHFVFDSEGTLKSWNRTLENEAPGASLEKKEALRRAKEELARGHGIDLSNEDLVLDDVNQEAKRRDYLFTFERKDFDWGEAKLRTSIRVQGDEVMDFGRYLKIPEEWLREQSATKWKDVIVGQISSWVGMGRMGLFGFLFVVMIFKGVLPWKKAFLIATIPTVLGIIDQLNGLPQFFSDYNTTTPMIHYVGTQLGNLGFHIVLSYLGNVLELSIAFGLLQWAFGLTIQDLPWWPRDGVERRRLWMNAWVLAWVGVAVWECKSLLEAYASAWLLPEDAVSYAYPSVNSALPWISSLISGIDAGYTGIVTTALKVSLAVILYRHFPRAMWMLLFALPVYGSLDSKDWAEFWLRVASSELTWLLNFVLVWRLWRFNAPALFLACFMENTLASTEIFFVKGGPSYEWNALPLAAAIILPLLLAWWSGRQGSKIPVAH